jgi:hypothetical protein
MYSVRSLLPKAAPFKLYLENLKFDIGEGAIQEFFTKRGLSVHVRLSLWC